MHLQEGHFVFPVKLTASRFGNLTRFTLLCYITCDDFTYIHIIISSATSDTFFSITQHARYIPIIVGVGKERRKLICSW